MAEIVNQLGKGLGDRQVAPTTAADRPVEPARDLRPAQSEIYMGELWEQWCALYWFFLPFTPA
jgi:hypothetical protein